MSKSTKHHYKPTESKYRGGAREMYITYDLRQETRGGGSALYPKVKRVYISGEVNDWQAGAFKKRTGKEVHGVRISYERRREGYERKGYTATRGSTRYEVPPTKVGGGKSSFSQIVEVPAEAQNIQFHAGRLPEKYQEALQDIA